MVIWVMGIEIQFFIIHKILHNNYLYKYIHKIHHKFKITNCLTSFYSHPIDNLLVTWTAFNPIIVMVKLGYTFSITTISFYIILILCIFISSHHTFIINNNIVVTNHYLHHLKTNINFGNFLITDSIYQKIIDIFNRL